MRRTALFVVGCALPLFIGVAPAAADNGPHIKGAGYTPDTCAACHRAHTAKAPYLLKESQSSLCFTCHGAGGTGSSEDVQEGVGWSGAKRTGTEGALRGGGFEYALLNTSAPEVERSGTGKLIDATIKPLASGQTVTSTHSINPNEEVTAWGNGALESGAGKSIKLTCGSCHDPHGNGNFRILKGKPDEAETKGGPTVTEVNIPDATTKVYTTENYWHSWDTNDKSFKYQIAEWCTTCHTRYLAGSGSWKTPNGDAIYNYRHRSSYTQAEYESYEAESPVKARPNCIQCHVSHGSNASMGTNSQSVTWPDGSSAGADSRLLRLDNRGVCQTCHNK